ncbi:MAG: PilZ domain-containing protein [Deltaproteobacteria bacterium]|nr:PilZ domain-containing protein [Deltaproteobacteria bacterium]
MPSTRKIKAKEFLQDVRAGMTESELMEKFGLPKQAMDQILQKLLDSGLIRPSDLPARGQARPIRYDEVELSAIRTSPRYSSRAIELLVRELDNPAATGHVLDISEGGLAVIDLKGVVGESSGLLLFGPGEYLPEPIAFDAECRWITTDKSSGRTICGYEITIISEEDLERLQTLIGLLKEQGTQL